MTNFTAELWAAREGLALAWDRRYWNIILEVDSYIIFTYLQYTNKALFDGIWYMCMIAGVSFPGISGLMFATRIRKLTLFFLVLIRKLTLVQFVGRERKELSLESKGIYFNYHLHAPSLRLMLVNEILIWKFTM